MLGDADYGLWWFDLTYFEGSRPVNCVFTVIGGLLQRCLSVWQKVRGGRTLQRRHKHLFIHPTEHRSFNIFFKKVQTLSLCTAYSKSVYKPKLGVSHSTLTARGCRRGPLDVMHAVALQLKLTKYTLSNVVSSLTLQTSFLLIFSFKSNLNSWMTYRSV